MLIKIDNEIGTPVASDEPLPVDEYIPIDGRTITRKEYHEYFVGCGIIADSIKMNDMRDVLPGIMFYRIAKSHCKQQKT